MGVDLSLRSASDRDCRTVAGASESIGFLRKSTYSRSPNGGGSEAPVGLRSKGNPYVLTLLMGVDLSIWSASDRDCRTSSDTSESMVFLRKSIYARSPNGGGSKPQNPLRLNCRATSGTSESMVFLRNSTHSRSPNGGGSKPQVGQRSGLPDLIQRLRSTAFPKEILAFSLS